MNQEIKQRWLKALRSGEYEQGKQQLRWHDQFCCLGVLCDLHAKETGNEWKGGLNRKPHYLGQDHILPLAVMEWADLDDDNPPIDDLDHPSLAELNDEGASFAAIADVIEAQL